MGTRADKWPKERLAGMAAFFTKVGYKYTAEWKEESSSLTPARRNSAASNEVAMVAAVFPDGTAAHVLPDQDPRAGVCGLADRPEDPWFTQNIANRIWAWLLGRGIIQEPDDARPDNPPSNPELLALLERELITSHYDLKHLLPADPDFEDLPAFLHPEGGQCRGGCQLLALSPPPAGCGGAD